MSNHSSYRPIDATPFGDAARVTSGEAIAFDGNGSSAPTQGRVPAFLGLAERSGGVYLERTGDNPPTVAEAIRRVGLDREVRKEALSFQPTAEAPVGLPGRRAHQRGGWREPGVRSRAADPDL